MVGLCKGLILQVVLSKTVLNTVLWRRNTIFNSVCSLGGTSIWNTVSKVLQIARPLFTHVQLVNLLNLDSCNISVYIYIEVILSCHKRWFKDPAANPTSISRSCNWILDCVEGNHMSK